MSYLCRIINLALLVSNYSCPTQNANEGVQVQVRDQDGIECVLETEYAGNMDVTSNLGMEAGMHAVMHK